MRIYTSFTEALNEIKRDIAELGMKVHPQTMQDLQIADDPDYETMEYLNMMYMVTQPRLVDLEPHIKNHAWCVAEFDERIRGLGPFSRELMAWQERPEIWAQFQGHLGYTYGERYRGKSDNLTDQPGPDNLEHIIHELSKHPDTRQAFLPVFDSRDPARLGVYRVPCSLGYWFALRQKKLHITYLQRSGDYFTHLANDLWLTHRLQQYVALRLDVNVGSFTHWIGSVHVYKKDVADVF
jgi:thymidylate synthase